jgi:2-iminoacetate synthase
MPDFELDGESLQRELARIALEAPTRDLSPLLERAVDGEGLEPSAIAALWYGRQIATDAIYSAARRLRSRWLAPLETFSPLYMTNTCDAECRMCGMRRDNEALKRETVDFAEVESQLRTLSARGMHAVSLLTGEYRRGRREWALRFVNQALRATQALGFKHVLINVGSIDDDEFETLLAGIERQPDGAVVPKLTMCTFQETYSRAQYAKFMGTEDENPRADFDRRLSNFDRTHRAGMRVANPGILLGLNPELGFELIALAMHARHLLGLGMEVYLSVPRMRRVAGGHAIHAPDEDEFVRLVSLLTLGVPGAKVVITTREPAAVQRRLVPIVAVLSAGSASVAPYTADGARFPLESSQFEVIDQRRFEDILGEYIGESRGIENFEPRAVLAV